MASFDTLCTSQRGCRLRASFRPTARGLAGRSGLLVVVLVLTLFLASGQSTGTRLSSSEPRAANSLNTLPIISGLNSVQVAGQIPGLPAPTHQDAGTHSPFPGVTGADSGETASPSATVINGLYEPTGITYDSQNGELYVVTHYGTNVSVVNPVTNTTVTNIPIVGALQTYYRQGIAYDSENHDVYFAGGQDEPYSASGSNVSVVNGSTNTVTKNLDAGVGPSDVAIDPSNGNVYVTDVGNLTYSEDNVTVINGTTNVVQTIIGMAGCTAPSADVFDSANGLVYVASDYSGSLCWINSTTNEIAGSLNLGSDQTPLDLALDPSTGYLYVVGGEHCCNPSIPGTLEVVNTATNTEIFSTYLPATDPNSGINLPGIVFDGRTGEILIAQADYGKLAGTQPYLDSLVEVYNGTTRVGSLNAQLDNNVAAPGLAYDANDGDAYVTNWASGSISILAPGMPLAPNVSPSSGAFVTGSKGNFSVATTQCLDGSCGAQPSFSWSLNNSLGSLNRTTGPDVRFTAGPNAGDATLTSTSSLDGYAEETQIPISIHPPFVAQIEPDFSSTDVNATLPFVVQTTGGSGGPYTFLYSESSPTAGCSFYDIGFVTCKPTSPIPFSVAVNATDGSGEKSDSASGMISVGPQLFAGLSVSNATPLLGQTLAFVVNASGGAPPYSFNYTGFPPGCISEDKAAVGCLPTQADYYNVTAEVRDQNNVTVSSTVEIHVIFDFNVVVPATTSAGSPFTISVNTNESFSGGTAVEPTGGFGAFTYNYSGLPPGCQSQDLPTITCTPSQIGEYEITVSVHDQVGDHNSHTVRVDVVEASPAGSSLPISGSLFWYVLIGAGVAIAVVAFFFILRRRRSTRSSPVGKPEATPAPAQTKPPG